MKKRIIKWLLAALNSRFLNQTPCPYGHVNGIEAMSYEALKSEDAQQPGITVRQVIEEIDRFKSCPMTSSLTVIENGEYRDGTVWDVHELRNLGRKRVKE